MELGTKKAFEKSNYNPVALKSYKITKKLIKYSVYIALLYFAYEGFMAWQ
ncbi:hypothetical protein [Chitinophaga filiformis]|uniref:Uncharacterized protein n=1 Tax=Chitinophaga filiformis TaxID=104663 RepID=A0A1G7SGH7_CHIFI|nr:hypothetical protein [Chitinophaga filiformis]SDG22041.1 hypothetical protein SAMN04488121_103861 [Chitinophaga filiformis]